MSPNQVVEDAKRKLTAAVQHFEEELKKLRTGRANASMLDGVMVEAYGTSVPLNQVATVSAPEAQLLQISPFDPSNLQAISSAIRDNPSLGMNPADDGRIVRVPVPPLTEERRREMVKLIGQKQEAAMISLRNVRREAMDAIDRAKKDKTIGEDEAKRLEKQVDDVLNGSRTEAETASKVKEQEVMTL
jgi:ribosome recycling factor